MFRINKGLFGLYNYEGTKLEVKPEDGFVKGCLNRSRIKLGLHLALFFFENGG